MAKKKELPEYEVKELRLYTFVNFYLSSIQQGIQSAHVVSEMASEYRGHRTVAKKLFDLWCDHGKTLIVLNAGMAQDVNAVYIALDNAHQEVGVAYPYTAFCEEPGAIHQEKQAITACGIVLPPYVYNAKHRIEVFPSRNGFACTPQESWKEGDVFWEEGTPEHAICTILEGKGLAR